jgi:hypothetical protein
MADTGEVPMIIVWIANVVLYLLAFSAAATISVFLVIYDGIRLRSYLTIKRLCWVPESAVMA